MTGNKRVHVIVEGRVQGVFFRAYTRDEAVKLGLSGWVRNRTDGSVEVLIEGEKIAVEKMEQWLHEGSPHSLIKMIHTTEEAPMGALLPLKFIINDTLDSIPFEQNSYLSEKAFSVIPPQVLTIGCHCLIEYRIILKGGFLS